MITLSFAHDIQSAKETENYEFISKEWEGITYFEIYQLTTPSKRLKPLSNLTLKNSPAKYSPGLYSLRRQIQEVEKDIARLKEAERKSKIIYSIQEKVTN